eukprot:tig00000498_g1590.t1
MGPGRAGSLLALLALLATASGAPSKYQWRVDVADPANPSSPAPAVVPGADYLLVVRVADETGAADAETTRELSALGLKPRFFYQYEASIEGSSLNTSWEAAYQPPSEEWRVPFRTGEAGIAQLTVLSNHVGAFGVYLPDKVVSFAVSPFQARVGPGQYRSLVGAESAGYEGGGSYRLPGPVLQPDLVPGVSPVGLVLFDGGAGALLASASEFRDSVFLAPDLARFAAEPPACPDLPAASLQGALALANRLLLSTRYGLVQAAAPASGPGAGPRELVWSIALRQCVAVLSNPAQYNAFRTAFNDHQFALTAPPEARVFVSFPARRLLRAPGLGAGAVGGDGAAGGDDGEPGGAGAAAAAGGGGAGGALGSGGRYALRTYNVSGRAWAAAFEFPAAIPDDSSTGTRVVHVPATAPPGGVALELSGLQFARAVSRDLFATGNALLYSASGGRSWVVLRVFAPRRVAQLETSSAGTYALLLDNAEAWYGVAGTATLVQLSGARADPAAAGFGAARALLFDLSSALFELTLAVGPGGALAAQRADPYTAKLEELMALEALQRGEACPVSAVAVAASHSSLYTRQPDEEPVGLPAGLFLDRGASYSFALSLNASEEYWRQREAGRAALLQEPALLLQVGRTDLVSVTLEPLPHDGSPIFSYLATVNDLSAYPAMSPPGERLEVTPVRLLVAGAAGACAGAVAARYETEVHTGCPPGRRLVFDPLASGTAIICSEKFGVPCFKMADDFLPVFNLTDTVANTTGVYRGRFFLEAVAAGETPSSLRRFTEEEITRFNHGKALTFVPIDDVAVVEDGGVEKSVYTRSTNTIQWVCAPGNPCEIVFPKGGEPPELYLELRATTIPERASYCNHTARFTVLLTGISMDATTTYISVGVTIGFLVFLVCVSALVHRFRHPEFFGYEPRAGARPHEE